jgi:stage II sporulation protein D
MTKYFEISSGNTNSYKEIYGTNIPYLVGIPSPFDTVANNYKTKKVLTETEVDTAIKASFANYKANNDTSRNISDIMKNDYGTVLSLKAGNTKLTGKELADTLNLRSSAFEVTISNESYAFITYGYGENIGMSQFGACKMAEQGNSYIEILQYYYPNTEISENFKPL